MIEENKAMAPDKPKLFFGKPKIGPKAKDQKTTEKDRSTKTIGKLKDEHEKEAVLVIWKYKSIESCGHAALKLKKMDDADDKVKRLDYISWWPSGGYIDTEKVQKIVKKKLPEQLAYFQPRHGGAHKDYRTDESAELGGSKKIAIFLSYLHRACNSELPDLVDKYLKGAWHDYPGYHEEWKTMGFKEDFGNMDDMIKQDGIGLGKRQKLLKDSRYRDPKSRGFDLGKMREDALEYAMQKMIDKDYDGEDHIQQAFFKFESAKLPDVKIYLPCAHLKRIVNPEAVPPVQFRFVWGLSLDAIRISWRIFKGTPNPQWQMITNEINCASVVWNRLMDGYADALLEGNTGDLIEALKREVFIQPNNIIALGDRLELELVRLNAQQGIIDVATQKHYPKIRDLAVSDKIALQDKDNWLSMLKSSVWHDISKTKNIRPPSLRKIDDEVKAFEKKSNEIKRDEERRIIKAIMQDDRRYVDLNDELDKARKAKAPAFRIKSLKDKIEYTRKMMTINFKMITKHRHQKVKHLVKLHKAVYQYLESAKTDDERLPSVLLLAQCVACAFFETMHHGVTITLRAQQHSFVPETTEEDIDYKEAVVSPTVDLRIMT
jgi:hypothetical protein